MAIGYTKDKSTGVVVMQGDGTVMLAEKRPALDSPLLADWVKGRNHSGRVFIPNGEGFSVQVVTKGRTYVVASGTTFSPTAGKLCPVLVRVRQEEELTEPEAPVGKIG